MKLQVISLKDLVFHVQNNMKHNINGTSMMSDSE